MTAGLEASRRGAHRQSGGLTFELVLTEWVSFELGSFEPGSWARRRIAFHGPGEAGMHWIGQENLNVNLSANSSGKFKQRI
jgi:hypothetical protein